MQQIFITHFNQNFSEFKENLAVAVSGGIDSVVLCHLLNASQIKFFIVHCNFKLRGEESERDALFVKNLAHQYQCRFFYKEFNTQEFAQTHRCSIQMAARDLRYQWFNELIKNKQVNGIATAHHLDDQLETFFINLLRGTGIKGLTGIPEKNANIFRPLLPFTRSEIKEYARQHQLAFCEDSSNLKDDYLRNKLRHHLIPLLCEYNPQFYPTFINTLQNLKFAENVYSKHIEQIKKNCFTVRDNEILINKNFLYTLPYQEFYLFEWLKEFNFNFSTIRQITANLTEQAGKQFFSETHVCTNDRNYLFISPKTTENEQIYYIEENCNAINIEDKKFNFKNQPFANLENIEKSLHTAYLDKSKLNFPLMLRKWRSGDRIKPLGMQQYKKISDILIDLKIPLHYKKNIYVLTSGEEIVWLVGYRISDDFKCTSNTKEIFKITFEQTNDN